MHTTPHHAATDGPAVGSTIADAGADPAWAGLQRARLGNRPDAVAAAEDRVFRLYLPLARALASELSGGGAAAPADVEWVAELGLAKAVLGWPGVDGRGFEAYAREAITARLGQLSSSHPHQQATAAQLSSMVRRFPARGRPKGH